MSRDPLLTPQEVAGVLGSSERFVLDELRRKNLVGVKTGIGWRVDPEDLDVYIEASKTVRPVRSA